MMLGLIGAFVMSSLAPINRSELPTIKVRSHRCSDDGPLMRCTPPPPVQELSVLELTFHGNTFRRDALGWHRMLMVLKKGIGQLYWSTRRKIRREFIGSVRPSC